MKIKKHVATLLAFLLLMTVGLTACNNEAPSVGDDSQTQVEDSIEDDSSGVEDENSQLEDSTENEDIESEDMES